ncbi:alpha/beta fold hydrolase [Microbacterium sp. SSW1-59]|uniref:alpha/beta fold hydrolase n=1 Tax=Microbacterium xanthum TaxID=3079794 RepID=UPI002AD5665D|nr:alpha/beta fold hydrolase [Microbacterium sp. SSW1-59]MDZ8201640.1 alpha/beta fold hydrolase [Microbacterium sp. SSW1-59]
MPPVPGLDERFRRVIEVPGVRADTGRRRSWHHLDTGPVLADLGLEPVGTILAVHGNPTWSFHWRRIAAESVRRAERGGPAWRLVAVDQLEMGFSERTDVPRTLAQRVADLGAFTDALALTGPVVTLGHDWGGVISLGWAVDHPDLVAGIITLNTAVHHPEGVPIPAPLRLAGVRGVLAASTVRTTAFLETTLGLAEARLPREVRDGYRAPYRSAARRRGIGQFVADIPVDHRHPSHAELTRIADGVRMLTVPALILWGPRDPVFQQRYLDDLIDRVPHAEVHRFEGAGHLVGEDRPCAEAVLDWLDRAGLDAETSRRPPRSPASADADFEPMWRRLDERADDTSIAAIDMTQDPPLTVGWRQLHERVTALAAGLTRLGVRHGDRVSLLVRPGPTLTAVVYACLRIGAVVVVADAGLGVNGLSRAVRGASPRFLIGETAALTAARTLGWPGTKISVDRLPRVTAAALGVSCSLADLAATGAGGKAPDEPVADDVAAILFTSGSTGPAKGVVYTHGQLAALRNVLAAHFDVAAESGLVTGFAPFALLGPALGTRSVTPDMDVSAPRTLTATAVSAAVATADARIVFLSPAAILNVVDTAGDLTAADREVLARVTTFLSTGAPIGADLLAAAQRVFPHAAPHTPYGMTECLLVTDITLDGIRRAADAEEPGVCVGAPIDGVTVGVSALDAEGRATGPVADTAGVLGEIVVSAPHLKTRYDRLALTDAEAVRDTPGGDARWHRTGDVGHLDARGRLWVEGRLPHVLVTEGGPLAPVAGEQQAERVDGVRRAALVGVGPHGLRRAVIVVETTDRARRAGLADPDLTARVRAAVVSPLAAVLVVPELPTDIRHNSKIDRSRLSEWADLVCAGGRITAP